MTVSKHDLQSLKGKTSIPVSVTWRLTSSLPPNPSPDRFSAQLIWPIIRHYVFQCLAKRGKVHLFDYLSLFPVEGKDLSIVTVPQIELGYPLVIPITISSLCR